MTAMNLKLGKKAAVIDPRTLQLSNYILPSALPPTPTARRWDGKMGKLTMMLNDSLGDCTVAAAGHMVQLWTGNTTGHPVVVPDANILTAYEAVSGYRPGHHDTDNGAYCLDVLKYWRGTGVGGHKVFGFAAVDHHSRMLTAESINIFGGAYIGVGLPLTAADQIDAGHDWTLVSTHGRGAPGSWGGHAIPLVSFDATGLTCVTWSRLQRMSWDWYRTYCDEAYAVISREWLASNVTPSGFNFAQLQSDLAQI